MENNKKVFFFLPKEEIEVNAIAQIENVSRLPFVEGQAIMPDAHMGKGACVGSVVSTRGAIVPSIVGVDIGCGMIAVKTTLFAKHLPDNLDTIRLGIERRVPLGAGGRNLKETPTVKSRIQQLYTTQQDYYKGLAHWEEQLGSLGSGNHFIELSLDTENRVWVVLHSGSRGIGNQLATKHIKVAQNLMDAFKINLEDPELAYLSEKTEEFSNYIRDLHWAQEFARLNREEMMDRVMTELSYSLFKEDGHQKDLEVERVNCHHNFTQQEQHFGKNVWVSRKGAIQMRKGQLGIIPGSMGTRSYIVSGLENKLSFNSAPHGAGRNFSRAEARRRFTMEDFDKAMVGISHRRSKTLIDELPGAYKDIDQVMEYSKELVEIKHVLRQILNVKGD